MTAVRWILSTLETRKKKSQQRPSGRLPALVVPVFYWGRGSSWTSSTLGLVETGRLVAATIGRRAAGSVRAVTRRRPVARHVTVRLATGVELIARQRVTDGALEARARVPRRLIPRRRALQEVSGRREPATSSVVWAEQVSSGTKLCV